jgi:hypothetical protein
MDPGPYTARVVYPGQQTYRDVTFQLSPGRDEVVEVPVDPRTLIVRVIPEEGNTIPEGLFLNVHSAASGLNLSTQYYGIPPNGEVEIARADGVIVLTVDSFDGSFLGMARVEVVPDSTPPIEVRLDSREVRFRIIDRNRRALPGVTVLLNCVGSGVGWYRTGLTDGDGACSFTGISIREVLVLLKRYPEGIMAGRRVDLTNRASQPIELVYAPDWQLQVRLLERSDPAAGVDIAGTDPDGVIHLSPTPSDSQGIADLGPVSGTGWIVRVAHPSYWPQSFSVSSTDPRPYPIQVRRIGSVEFVLRTAMGNPADDVGVELMPTESFAGGGSTTTWLREGLIRASDPTARTDARGTLRFEGLANGSYRWEARTPSGEMLEGEVVVPPLAVELVEATLP